jgi:hypothetical protein
VARRPCARGARACSARPQLAALFSDPRVLRTNAGMAVPEPRAYAAAIRARGNLQGVATLLACILEAKPSHNGAAREEDEDEDRWVGVLDLALHPGRELHQDAMFGIALGMSAPCSPPTTPA